MKRLVFMTVLCVLFGSAQAQSLREMEVQKMLELVARESNEGTPRAINEDLLDQGYSVDGTTLINYISVQPRHAAMMRDNLEDVRSQLQGSVCGNPGFVKLLKNGAALRYEFSEYKSNRFVTSQRFQAGDCGL